MKESDLWILLDTWLKKQTMREESIRAGYGYGKRIESNRTVVHIEYCRITNNQLIQREVTIDKIFLCRLSEATILTIMADFLQQFREAEL